MPALTVSPYVFPVLLLIGSNAFVTTDLVLVLALQGSAPVAGGARELGPCLLRILSIGAAIWYGNATYSAAQLKTIQEVITLSMFGLFSRLSLNQTVTWNQMIGFAFIALGAFFVFRAPI